MNGVNQKNFGLFFTTLSDLQGAHLLIKTGKSDKDVIKIILSKFMKPHHIRKSNMKPKFFLGLRAAPPQARFRVGLSMYLQFSLLSLRFPQEILEKQNNSLPVFCLCAK